MGKYPYFLGFKLPYNTCRSSQGQHPIQKPVRSVLLIDTDYECDRQTDRQTKKQTDERELLQQMPRLCALHFAAMCDTENQNDWG